jgi:hypothetical protein
MMIFVDIVPDTKLTLTTMKLMFLFHIKNPFSDDFTFVDHFSASVPAPPAGTVSNTPVPAMHTVPVLEHPVSSAVLLAPATVPDPDPLVPDTVAPDPATVCSRPMLQYIL